MYRPAWIWLSRAILDANISVMKQYEKLKAWKSCHQLVLVVYRVSATWPAAERYGLIAQARRAAFSSAANIAEGAAKRGHKEFRRFLDISLGSLAELSYIVKLVRDLGMLADQPAAELEAVRDEAGRLTWGLYRHVSRNP